MGVEFLSLCMGSPGGCINLKSTSLMAWLNTLDSKFCKPLKNIVVHYHVSLASLGVIHVGAKIDAELCESKTVQITNSTT